MSKKTGFITVTATGANVTTGAASASAAIPVAASGEVPRYVRIAATVAAHVRLGVVGVTALATDMLLMPNDSVVVAVPRGLTHFAAIQDTAAGAVNVTPLEDC